MKKIVTLLITLFLAGNAFASEDLSFIYINGSNNNDAKMKTWFENGIKKFHPVLRKKLLKKKAIKKHFENEGGITIKEEPVIFFWGYNSHDDLEFVKKQLEISKMVSSSGAYLVRNLISQYLHDAIWIQKQHNMLPVLDDLNEYVKKEAKDGNDVILFGYSAGTFVTYEYMFNKLRYVKVEKLFEDLNEDKEMMNFVKKNPRKDTCISALQDRNSGIGTFSQAGHIFLNPNKEMLKANYLKLDEITECNCAPVGKFRGIVNYASPLPLFYSDFGDKNYELNYYNKLMAKYIMENGIYMLTVNFKEDPLGFPTSSNLTAKDMEQCIDISIKNPTGVIYDNSGVWSKRMFPFAHTAYWSAKGTFANAIVKSFINGYRFQYDEEYQKKVLKKHRKKSEL